MNHQVKKMALFGIAHLSWPRIALCCPTCDTACWAKHGKLIAAPFPHILLPRSNTAHPEHRERTLILFEEKKKRKKKRRSSPPSEQLPCDPAPRGVTACPQEQRVQPTSNPALPTNDFRANAALHSECQPPPVTCTSSLLFIVVSVLPHIHFPHFGSRSDPRRGRAR